jgi:hypothetical protein
MIFACDTEGLKGGLDGKMRHYRKTVSKLHAILLHAATVQGAVPGQACGIIPFKKMSTDHTGCKI